VEYFLSSTLILIAVSMCISVCIRQHVTANTADRMLNILGVMKALKHTAQNVGYTSSQLNRRIIDTYRH